jgi:acetyl-CoA carboxylase biotin carboxyl carrier protein
VADHPKSDVKGAPRPFDVLVVDHLVKLMSEHDLSEVYLEEGEQVIRLRRGGKLVAAASQPTAPIPLPQTNPAAPATASGGTASAAPTGKKPIEIKSPTPGTFYRASSPDADAFVKVGSKVKPDTIVCIIEAMKVFNEIPAEVSGTIIAVKAEDKQPVEYGQVLFHVEPD